MSSRGTEYKFISKKGEGTFSEVLKAVAVKNGKYYAIKRMKNHFDRYATRTPTVRALRSVADSNSVTASSK